MFINGTEVTKTNTDEGTVINVNNTFDFLIAPNTISQAWILHESKRYDLIKSTRGWKGDIYNHIINTDGRDIMLIALLLSCK